MSIWASFFSVIDGLRKGMDIHGKDLDAEETFFIGPGWTPPLVREFLTWSYERWSNWLGRHPIFYYQPGVRCLTNLQPL